MEHEITSHRKSNPPQVVPGRCSVSQKEQENKKTTTNRKTPSTMAAQFLGFSMAVFCFLNSEPTQLTCEQVPPTGGHGSEPKSLPWRFSAMGISSSACLRPRNLNPSLHPFHYGSVWSLAGLDSTFWESAPTACRRWAASSLYLPSSRYLISHPSRIHTLYALAVFAWSSLLGSHSASCGEKGSDRGVPMNSGLSPPFVDLNRSLGQKE